MASVTTKRPSSARRNIKQETFSSFASSCRLRNVQSMLQDDVGDAGVQPDAVLCILGIDSRYNEGSRELISYLLFNFFESRRTEIERSGFPEEVIDDLIILVRQDRVHVYCNPINYLYLLPYIAHWHNLRLHCMTEKDYENVEAAEEFKISSFVEMAEGCRCIGIPFNSLGGQDSRMDKMVIEKWPIIQAYALEGFGGGGFFTLKYKVLNISEELHQMYHDIDPVSLETVVTEQLTQFERQWDTLITVVDAAKASDFNTLTECTVCEPISSYFFHGRVGSAKSRQGTSDQNPFVLFGSHSNYATLEKASQGVTMKDVTAKNSGIDGSQATHMVIHAVASRGPLSCTRTYFFGNGITPHQVSLNPVKYTEEKRDLSVLVQLYGACVEAAHAAIKTYSKTLSVSQASAEAVRVLQQHGQAIKLPHITTHLSNRRSVEVCIEAHDNDNSTVVLQGRHPELLVKTATVSVYDVPGIRSVTQSLGTVSYGDAFFDSTLSVQVPGGSTSSDSQFCVLTNHVPKFVNWPYHNEEAKVMSSIREFPARKILGKQLVPGEPAHLVSEANGEPLYNGQVYIQESGLVFVHDHLGAIVVPKAQLEAIQFYDGESTSVMALLILTYRVSYLDYVPCHLRAPSRRLMVAFKPRSKAYKELFSDVLPAWKKEDQKPRLEGIQQLPDALKPIHSRLQMDHQTEKVPPTTPLRTAKARLPTLDKFLDHFAASSVLTDHSIPQRELPAVLNMEYDSGGFDDPEELVLTVLSGVPGSHKEALCDVLTRMSKDATRWAVFRHPVDSADPFSASSLQAQLASLITASKKRRPSSANKKTRAIVVTPGFTDIVDVMQAISNHPNKEVASLLTIGAVTVCVDPSNMFIENRYTLPKLIDQCVQGWVNNIVFTGSKTNTTALSEAQQLIRAVNSDVALLLAERGEVTRSPDLDLILSETAFSEGALVRARHLSCPGWNQGRYLTGGLWPDITEVSLRFSKPLDKKKLTMKLHGLKSTGRTYPFSGKIFHVRGRVEFLSEELVALSETGQDVEFTYPVLSGHLHLAKPDRAADNDNGEPKTSANCVIFSGCDLQEEWLEDWLRECAPQKPEKKPLRAKGSLNESEIKKIHDEHHLDPLPPGWFFNGSSYVSFDGDKLDVHPCLDEFMDEYLDNRNKEIEAFNVRVDQMVDEDLFD